MDAVGTITDAICPPPSTLERAVGLSKTAELGFGLAALFLFNLWSQSVCRQLISIDDVPLTLNARMPSALISLIIFPQLGIRETALHRYDSHSVHRPSACVCARRALSVCMNVMNEAERRSVIFRSEAQYSSTFCRIEFLSQTIRFIGGRSSLPNDRQSSIHQPPPPP